MEYLRFFNQLGKNDAAIAGGKGASLGEMTQASIPVPPGFVVLSAAFEKFLEETDLSIEIDSLLEKVKHEDVYSIELASEKIQTLIIAAKMPDDIAETIQKFFHELGTEYVAVRSSATAEDSASAAWAGQLDSFLNTTEKDLLEKVKRCWASLFTPRAIFYRFEQNLHTQKISVAVVIQKMVVSEVSGIAFSVHPVTQDYNQLIIEAGFGLGEAIVSGQITPDSYVVEKEPRRIIDKNVVEQTRGIFRIEGGPSSSGTSARPEANGWQNILSGRGNQQKLNDEQILELSEIILGIEKHYGFPCDIEWAYENGSSTGSGQGKFYIVQSRPITTLVEKSTSCQRVFKKMFTRDYSLITAQCWYRGEREGLLKITDGVSGFESLFVFDNKRGTSVYFENSDPKQTPQRLVNYFIGREEAFDLLVEKYHQSFKELERTFNSSEKVEDLKSLFDKIIYDVWPVITLGVILGREVDNPLIFGIAEKAKKIRFETEKYEFDIAKGLKKIIEVNFPEFKEYSSFIGIDDLINQKLTVDELKKRADSYIYFEDKIFINESLPKFSKAHNLELQEDLGEVDQSDNIKGSTAWNGKVTGKVRVIFSKKDIDLFQAGEILVTPMTSPDFVPALKKAVAIITDEGGITCHAAIVARELKKPCIIGTKIATQILHDGDLVEVDADNGVVRILEKVV